MIYNICIYILGPGNNFKDIETLSIVRNRSARYGRIIFNYLDFKHYWILFSPLNIQTCISVNGRKQMLNTIWRLPAFSNFESLQKKQPLIFRWFLFLESMFFLFLKNCTLSIIIRITHIQRDDMR